MKKLSRILFAFAFAFASTADGNAQSLTLTEQLKVAPDLKTSAKLLCDNADYFTKQFDTGSLQSYLWFVVYTYNASYPWVYHTDPDKEKRFEEFYQEYGKLYPTFISPLPSDPKFYDALNDMVILDPIYFEQTRETPIPLKYLNWLQVKNLTEECGKENILCLMEAASKMVSRQDTK